MNNDMEEVMVVACVGFSRNNQLYDLERWESTERGRGQKSTASPEQFLSMHRTVLISLKSFQRKR